MPHIYRKYNIYMIFASLFSLLILLSCQTKTSQPSQPQTNEPMELTTTVPTETIQATSTHITQPTTTQTTTAPVIIQNGEDTAHFIGETIPDGSIISPGESFTKVWTLKNSGSNTWTTDYHLIIFASPQGDTLSSPASIQFPEIVQPGEKTEISLDLIAPETKGNYAVYWQLQNGQNNPFFVDGGNLWIQVTVAEPGDEISQPNSQAVNVSQVSNISIELFDIQIGPVESWTEFCIYFPFGEEKMPGSSNHISLIYNGGQIMSTAGNSVNINQAGNPSGGYRCYHFIFPVGQAEIPSGATVSVSISSLRYMDTNAAIIEANCALASVNLPTQYPGLSFTCLPFSAGAYYTNLQTPSSMTEEQANQIILDAIQDAVYGPWILTKEITP